MPLTLVSLTAPMDEDDRRIGRAIPGHVDAHSHAVPLLVGNSNSCRRRLREETRQRRQRESRPFQHACRVGAHAALQGTNTDKRKNPQYLRSLTWSTLTLEFHFLVKIV